MITEYFDISFEINKAITKKYSTSFSFGILAFSPEYRNPIYGIYGFVRIADEIVDTFHGYDKKKLLDRFREDTHSAIKEGISANPVINAFQEVVRKYNIETELIDSFLDSMEMDIEISSHGRLSYDKYVYGSAEAVGLMCLKVFCSGNETEYNKLKYSAKKLGSAFQKVNFLRDINSDLKERGRIYLPDTDNASFITDERKKLLENEVEEEFKDAIEGIKKLPAGVKLGVYSAYIYYLMLFKKIKKTSIKDLLTRRIRIPNWLKAALFVKSFVEIKLEKVS